MVTRLVIVLALLAATAQGQVLRKVLRPDLGSVTNGTGCVSDVVFVDGKVWDLATRTAGALSNATINSGGELLTATNQYALAPALSSFGTASNATFVLLARFISYNPPNYAAFGFNRAVSYSGLHLTISNQYQVGWASSAAEYNRYTAPELAFAPSGRQLLAGTVQPTGRTIYLGKTVRFESEALSGKSLNGAVYTLGYDPYGTQRWTQSAIWRWQVYNITLPRAAINSIQYSRRPTQ